MYNQAMALHINNQKADRLARQLARRTGQSITDAVVGALEAQLSGTKRLHLTPKQKVDRINEIVRQVSKLPVLDDRSADEILGYDEHGLPT